MTQFDVLLKVPFQMSCQGIMRADVLLCDSCAETVLLGQRETTIEFQDSPATGSRRVQIGVHDDTDCDMSGICVSCGYQGYMYRTMFRVCEIQAHDQTFEELYRSLERFREVLLDGAEDPEYQAWVGVQFDEIAPLIDVMKL